MLRTAWRMPLAVLDQSEAHVALAVLAEADAGRDRDLRLLEQQLAEGERAAARDTARARGAQTNIVAGGEGTCQPARAEALDQHVAALAVAVADLLRRSLRRRSSAAIAATWIGVKAP